MSIGKVGRQRQNTSVLFASIRESNVHYRPVSWNVVLSIKFISSESCLSAPLVALKDCDRQIYNDPLEKISHHMSIILEGFGKVMPVATTSNTIDLTVLGVRT